MHPRDPQLGTPSRRFAIRRMLLQVGALLLTFQAVGALLPQGLSAAVLALCLAMGVGWSAVWADRRSPWPRAAGRWIEGGLWCWAGVMGLGMVGWVVGFAWFILRSG